MSKAQKTFIAAIDARMDLLRETARQIRAGNIHPAHVANRIEKIANEISREKK